MVCKRACYYWGERFLLNILYQIFHALISDARLLVYLLSLEAYNILFWNWYTVGNLKGNYIQIVYLSGHKILIISAVFKIVSLNFIINKLLSLSADSSNRNFYVSILWLKYIMISFCYIILIGDFDAYYKLWWNICLWLRNNLKKCRVRLLCF